MFNSQQDVISSIPSLFSLSLSLSLFLPLSIYLSLSLYLSLTSLLTSNLSLGASALACMFFLPSVPHSFLPSFIPLLLPPTGTFLIPSFSSFAFLASFPFSLYCKGHTATPHGAVSEYFVGSGVLNRWKKRFFRFPIPAFRFIPFSVFYFPLSVFSFPLPFSVFRFTLFIFHFPFSALQPGSSEVQGTLQERAIEGQGSSQGVQCQLAASEVQGAWQV